MNDINPKASEHAEIREAVRAACTPFDSAYWQRVERGAGSDLWRAYLSFRL